MSRFCVTVRVCALSPRSRMRSVRCMADPRLEPLVLSGDERCTLENWVRRRSTTQGLALRARIVLACAGGGSNLAVAAWLGGPQVADAFPAGTAGRARR